MKQSILSLLRKDIKVLLTSKFRHRPVILIIVGCRRGGLQEEETNGSDGTKHEAAAGNGVGGAAWDVSWDWQAGGVRGGIVWWWWWWNVGGWWGWWWSLGGSQGSIRVCWVGGWWWWWGVVSDGGVDWWVISGRRRNIASGGSIWIRWRSIGWRSVGWWDIDT